MKPESKLWQRVKKNTPNILWTRIESWASFGFPDLIGYTENRGFFTVELKVTKSNKVSFSPQQIAFHIKHPTNTFILVETADHRFPILFPGSSIRELADQGLAAPGACALASWTELERLLAGLNACGLRPMGWGPEPPRRYSWQHSSQCRPQW